MSDPEPTREERKRDYRVALALVESWQGGPVRERTDGTAPSGTSGDLVHRIARALAARRPVPQTPMGLSGHIVVMNPHSGYDPMPVHVNLPEATDAQGTMGPRPPLPEADVEAALRAVLETSAELLSQLVKGGFKSDHGLARDLDAFLDARAAVTRARAVLALFNKGEHAYPLDAGDR